MEVDDVESPLVEQALERPPVHERMSGLLREPDGHRAERAPQTVDDDAFIIADGRRITPSGERAICVVVADHGYIMAGTYERMRERLHGHRVAAEATRRVEGGDHAEAERRHETAGMGAARRPIATTSSRAASVACALARQV